jgi:xylan 1,4-beta-xylosidase
VPAIAGLPARAKSTTFAPAGEAAHGRRGSKAAHGWQGPCHCQLEVTVTTIENPVLPGFHPDPSILRVGEDYFIANSTFEWWPGVRIHRSRDLVHWRHAAYALTRTSQLDLRGDPDSCGVWAPCLSCRDGLFYLVYSNVRSCLGAFKDTHNYVVTAPEITGPWSEPVYLTSVGFDQSFFHDEDGRTYLVGMKWDHRPAHNSFHGIFLQEYSTAESRLVGSSQLIFKGSSLGVTEGPHIYKRGGWYYLLVAEGGTSYRHAVSIARSRSLTGPYELSPHHPLLTSNGKPRDLLQESGHGSLVETPSGEWYIAHLCGRPMEWQGPNREGAGGYETLHCPLGRETAIQRVEWTDDGWPLLAGGDNAPAWSVPAPNLPQETPTPEPETDSFDSPELSPHFNSLRVPVDPSWLSLSDRPGFLRLYGRESFSSLHYQSLIARRLQAFRAEAETVVEFSPASFQQMAGLVAYYNTANHAYLRISHDEVAGRILGVVSSDGGAYQEDPEQIPLGTAVRVWLRVRFDLDRFRFWYALGPDAWRPVGAELPMALISDEHATRVENGIALSLGFTGAFVGLACQDLSGARLHADFDSFSYRS